jgi:hypothetical protein
MKKLILLFAMFAFIACEPKAEDKKEDATEETATDANAGGEETAGGNGDGDGDGDGDGEAGDAK